ncbi:ABC transporter substrate-binding protein [Alkaliphilus flagellatus]|nr:ABC transporter substrate-binding protein [Alkaliphilus flagellatus]
MMKRLMVLILSITLIAGLLVGCGGKDIEKESAGVDVSLESEGNQLWPRKITDATGKEIELKNKPERIAILHSVYLEHFLALNNPPIASAGSSRGDAMKAVNEWETLKPYKGNVDIIDLGSSREINLEAILKAKPDVIVTFKGHGGLDEVYDQLVKIAPVIQLDFSSSWQEQTLACAEIVGEEEYARKFIEETESTISNAKDKLSQYKNKTVALFRTDGKSFITRGDKDYYETFGITRPEGYPDEFETLSLETILSMNPDYIVFQDFIETAETFVKSQENLSVWKSLEAVKNGNVFYFDDSLNTFGPLAMRLTAEKLVDMYLK